MSELVVNSLIYCPHSRHVILKYHFPVIREKSIKMHQQLSSILLGPELLHGPEVVVILYYIPWHLGLSVLFGKAQNVLKTLMTLSASPAIRPQRGNKYWAPNFEERLGVPRPINQTRHTLYNGAYLYASYVQWCGKNQHFKVHFWAGVPLAPNHEWYFHSVTIQRSIQKWKEHFMALKEV